MTKVKDGFQLNNRLSVMSLLLMFLAYMAEDYGLTVLYDWAWVSFMICVIGGAIAVAFETFRLQVHGWRKEWTQSRKSKEKEVEGA